MIAKFETVVEPHPERFYALVYFPEFVEFFFVDETHNRDFLVAKSAQQLCRHLADGRRRHCVGGPGRQIVNGDRNLALWLFLCPRMRCKSRHRANDDDV